MESEDTMTHREDLLSLGFYERSPYTGSDGLMRYRIEKEEDKEEGRGRAKEEPLASQDHRRRRRSG